jgi:ABC-type sugar transport system ATPase subunit
MKMIELQDIKKTYKNELILENLNFTFKDNEKYIISGESGIGKTTLVRIIAGLEQPDSGKVYIDDILCTGDKIFIHPSERKTGFIFQEPTLWPHMNVKKNILFGVKNKIEIKKKEVLYNEIVNALQIENVLKKYPSQISHGQAKRVSIARTIILNPKHLIMDEALANLDKKTKDIIVDYIIKYSERYNTSLIYITHDTKEFEGIDRTVMQIKNKKLIFY